MPTWAMWCQLRDAACRDGLRSDASFNLVPPFAALTCWSLAYISMSGCIFPAEMRGDPSSRVFSRANLLILPVRGGKPVSAAELAQVVGS